MAQMNRKNPFLCWPPQKNVTLADVPADAPGVSMEKWRQWLLTEAPESARRKSKPDAKPVESKQAERLRL